MNDIFFADSHTSSRLVMSGQNIVEHYSPGLYIACGTGVFGERVNRARSCVLREEEYVGGGVCVCVCVCAFPTPPSPLEGLV